MTTINMTKTAENAYVRCLKSIDQLLPKLRENTLGLGQAVSAMLKLDRERGMRDIASRGLTLSTILGLERVGLGAVHTEVFLNGSVAAHMAEALDFPKQKLLVEKGVRVITGGTVEQPVVEVLRLKDFSPQHSRQVINVKEHRLYTLKEQAARRKQQYVTSRPPKYEVKGTQIIFHTRSWKIDDLKTIINSL
jgi:hypothetical protein